MLSNLYPFLSGRAEELCAESPTNPDRKERTLRKEALPPRLFSLLEPRDSSLPPQPDTDVGATDDERERCTREGGMYRVCIPGCVYQGVYTGILPGCTYGYPTWVYIRGP